ncbi:MAG: hypothetical protein K5777_03345 [Nitrosopumilus sp.]|nr:hypothetical protein [Nitrosopumilus sp.]
MNKLFLFSIAVVIVSSSVLFQESFAESTKLILNKPPSKVYAGDLITFSGKLSTASGQGISGAIVEIKDDDSWGPDDLVATTRTDSMGKFSVTVTAKDWDGWSDASEIYAVFEKSANYEKSRSLTYDVDVLQKPSNTTTKSQSSSYGSSNKSIQKQSTQISINAPSKAITGQTITISGKLTSNGNGLANQVVYIKDEDVADADDTLVRTTTDSNGRFSVNWQVKDVDSNDRKLFATLLQFVDPTFMIAPTANGFLNAFEVGTVELFASFSGNEKYSPSQSCKSKTTSNGVILKCKNNVLAILDKSGAIESKIMNQVLTGLIPGSGVLTNNSQDIFALLQSNSISKTEENLIKKLLISAIADETGIEVSTFDQAVQLLEKSSSSSSSSTKSTSNSYTSQSSPSYSSKNNVQNKINQINYQLDVYQQKIKTLERELQNTNSYLNSMEKRYNVHLGSSSSTLTNISNQKENKSFGSNAQYLLDNGMHSQLEQKIINENNRLDSLIKNVQSIKSSIQKKFIDSDQDGIFDSVDQCDYQKETFNGYKDTDGCPDTKPIDWKQKSLKSQNLVNSKIISMKSGINQAEKSLSGVWYDSAAQWNIDQAWTELWWAKKYLGDSEWTQKEGEKLIANNNFKNAFYKYEHSKDTAEKINIHLKNISFYLDKAHKVHYGK